MNEEKHYLTKKGLKRIQQEYDKLLEFKKAKTSSEVPPIWHSEEVSSEYLVFQEDLGLLEARIAEYEAIVKNAELIAFPPKAQRNTVLLGATVTLEEKPGKMINEYTLLGSIEANPIEGKISVASPVGKSLVGRKVGEEIVVSSPIKVVYRIKKIVYSSI
jgi:transcription elongation factor GreA